jgi:hypothetical protein
MDMPIQGILLALAGFISVHLLSQLETDREEESSPKPSQIQIFMAHPRIERGSTILRIVNGMWRHQVLWVHNPRYLYRIFGLYCVCAGKSLPYPQIEWGSTIIQYTGGMERGGTQHYRSP